MWYVELLCKKECWRICWLVGFQEASDDDDDSEPAEDMEDWVESGMIEDDSVSNL